MNNKTTVQLTKEVRDRLKILACENDVYIVEMMEKLIDFWNDKNNSDVRNVCEE